LLITSCSIYNGYRKPASGNTPNVIDIDCNNIGCKQIIPSNPTKPSTPTEPSTPEQQVDGEFEAYEKGKAWESINNLNIFANPMYDMEPKIAPESSNTYEFVVRNNTNYNLVYEMQFIETNDYNINMKYRLKKGNTYVAGDENTWVKANEINISNLKLDSSNKETYYLDWKWFSSDNDTEIGKQKNVGYKLDITIKAESIE
jgi:hypothetical protein